MGLVVLAGLGKGKPSVSTSRSWGITWSLSNKDVLLQIVDDILFNPSFVVGKRGFTRRALKNKTRQEVKRTRNQDRA